VRTLRIAAPWLAAGLILVLLLQRVDARATLAALAHGDATRHVPIAAAFGLFWLALDAYGLTWVFTRAAAPLRWSEMVVLRARSYPAMAVSFHLGSAALAALLQRATGAGIERTASALLLHYLADLAALSAVACAGSLFLELPGGAALRVALAATSLGIGGCLLLCRLGRLQLPGATRALGALGGGELAGLVLIRALFHASVSGFVWLTVPAFAISLRAADVVVGMPIVLAAGALPFTPGGLGTAQAAFVFVFHGLASEPALLAYALAYGATLLVLRLGVGFGAWLLPGRHERVQGAIA